MFVISYKLIFFRSLLRSNLADLKILICGFSSEILRIFEQLRDFNTLYRCIPDEVRVGKVGSASSWGSSVIRLEIRFYTQKKNSFSNYFVGGFLVIIQSVMQSDGNSFCGKVILESFNKAPRNDDNILGQKYEKQICSDFYYDDFNSL